VTVAVSAVRKDFFFLILSSESPNTLAVRGLRTAWPRHAVLWTVQKGVVEADVVGSALPARSCPVDEQRCGGIFLETGEHYFFG
jgi:ABC-type phosphate transport system auxiliary subunit